NGKRLLVSLQIGFANRQQSVERYVEHFLGVQFLEKPIAANRVTTGRSWQQIIFQPFGGIRERFNYGFVRRFKVRKDLCVRSSGFLGPSSQVVLKETH